MIEALEQRPIPVLKIKTTIIFSTHYICKQNKSQSHALRQPTDKEGAQMMR
jgi:hypothetical protein